MLIWVTTESFRIQAYGVTILKDGKNGKRIRITVDKEWRNHIQLKKDVDLDVDESGKMFDSIYIDEQFVDIQ